VASCQKKSRATFFDWRWISRLHDRNLIKQNSPEGIIESAWITEKNSPDRSTFRFYCIVSPHGTLEEQRVGKWKCEGIVFLRIRRVSLSPHRVQCVSVGCHMKKEPLHLALPFVVNFFNDRPTLPLPLFVTTNCVPPPRQGRANLTLLPSRRQYVSETCSYFPQKMGSADLIELTWNEFVFLTALFQKPQHLQHPQHP
jgi:hypothetical protein